MMIKGGIRIGGLGISGYDADAVAYFERAGVTDATAKGQINAFVKGVKDLGLYNNMVCWLLRSTQNSGTGTTAYSLGGLGTYNGTLVNSPTWGTNGLTNSATGRITTSYFSPSGSQTHIFVGNSGAGGGDRAYANTLSLDGITWSGFVFRDNGAYYGAGPSSFIQTVRDLTSAGNFKMAAALFNNPASSYTYLNTTQGNIGAGGAMLVSPTAMTIMSVASSQYFVGTASFYGTFVAELSTSQYTSIYNLYKTTLGTGLGLP
jgi:hypothetical protein